MTELISGHLYKLANGQSSLTHFQPGLHWFESVPFIYPGIYPGPVASQSSAEETGMAPQTIWLAEVSSGFPTMDKLHHDFFEALDELSSSKDHEFSAIYSAFVAKLERTFRQEEQWMEEIDFPLSQVHQEQHARVLGALHHVHARVMDGETGLGREVIDRLLPQWFAFHMTTMDTTLALAIQITQAETAHFAKA